MTDVYARYDYAWKTRGWTVQNPGYTNSVDTYVDPSLPAVSLVRVYGNFLDTNGLSLPGTFRVRRTTMLRHGPSGAQVLPDVQVFRFTQGGFSVALPATDDPDLTPEFSYEARLTVAGYTQEFTFKIPAATAEVNVLDLIPASTGDISIGDDGDDGSLEFGAVPKNLIVDIFDGADFVTDLTTDITWEPEDQLYFRFANGVTWYATLDGSTAYFNVPLEESSQVPTGTKVTLIAVREGNTVPWATGKAVRHG